MGKKTKKVKQQSAAPQVVSSVDGKDSFWGRYKYLLLVIGLSVFGIWPLFLGDLYNAHDLEHHLQRIAQYVEAFKDGQYLVRWLPDLMGGYGLPVFVFVPPLSYFATLLVNLNGFGVFYSYKITMALTIMLSGIAMFIFARGFFSRNASLIAAAAYMYAPYRFVDVYVRGAMPECMVFVFIPLAFLGVKKVIDKSEPKSLFLLSFASTGIVLSHNVTAMFIMPCVLLYGLYMIMIGRKPGAIVPLGIAFFLAIGLSAFYWMPALFEKKFALLEAPGFGVLKKFDFREHFVYLQQFFTPYWDYGGSKSGPLDKMSFQIGAVNVVVAITAMIIMPHIKDRQSRSTTIFFFFVFIVSIFFMTVWSSPFWEIVTISHFVQFPWRLLVITVFTAAFFAGAVMQVVESKPEMSRYVVIGILAASVIILVPSLFFEYSYGVFKVVHVFLYNTAISCLLLIGWFLTKSQQKYVVYVMVLLVILTAMPFWNIPLHRYLSGRPYIKPVTEQSLQSDMLRKVMAKAADSFEFVPKTVYDYVPVMVDKRNIVGIISGNVNISNIESKSDRLAFTVASSGEAEILVHVFYFPGWTAFIDGKETKTRLDMMGRMIVNIKDGTHNVVIKFIETDVRKTADLISLLSVLMFPGAYLIIWLKRRREKTKISVKK